MLRSLLLAGVAALVLIPAVTQAQGEQALVLWLEEIVLADGAPEIVPEGESRTFTFTFAAQPSSPLGACPFQSVVFDFQLSSIPWYATATVTPQQVYQNLDLVYLDHDHRMHATTAVTISVIRDAPAHDVGTYVLEARVRPTVYGTTAGCMLAPSDRINVPVQLINQYVHELAHYIADDGVMLANYGNGPTQVEVAQGVTGASPQILANQLLTAPHNPEEAKAFVAWDAESWASDWNGTVRIRSYDAIADDPQVHEVWETLTAHPEDAEYYGDEQTPVQALPGPELALLLPALALVLRRRRA